MIDTRVRIEISCEVGASRDILIRLPFPLIKGHKKDLTQGKPGTTMPHHLQKDLLLDVYASQGPLRQRNPAGAIQSPGEYSSSYLRLRMIKFDITPQRGIEPLSARMKWMLVLTNWTQGTFRSSLHTRTTMGIGQDREVKRKEKQGECQYKDLMASFYSLVRTLSLYINRFGKHSRESTITYSFYWLGCTPNTSEGIPADDEFQFLGVCVQRMVGLGVNTLGMTYKHRQRTDLGSVALVPKPLGRPW